MDTSEVKKAAVQVIKASAGSGKTYQLTLEYIKLLLGEKNVNTGEFRLKNHTEYHQHILAVTFTNKATEEMKGRIVEELNKLRLGKSRIADELVMELHTTDEELRKAAQKALEEILFNYTTFSVTTIDSFFQMVLRTFAYELDQDYDYAIELDSNYTASVAVHNMLMDIGGKDGNKIVAKWLGDYMRHQLELGKSWNVFSGTSLDDVAESLNSEIYRANKPKMDTYLSDVLASDDPRGKKMALSGTKIGKFKQHIDEQLKALDAEMDGFGVRFENILHSVGADVDNLSRTSGLAPIKNAIRNRKSSATLQEFVEKDFDDAVKTVGKWCAGTPWKKRVDANADGAKEALSEMQTLAEDILDVVNERGFLQSIVKNIYQLGLLGVAGKELDTFLKDNDIMLLSDTNQLLKDVLVDGNILFVYERLGTWINHYLIDEFQDTSTMQYHNLKPLLEESVSLGNENLVIGDEKQCIYRFRNSSPELLQSTIVDDFGDAVNVDNSKVVNWRSTPNIIRFNNTIFSKIVELLQVGDTYKNLVQRINDKPHKNSGLVKVNFVEDEDDVSGEGIITAKEKILKQLPGLINDMRQRGYHMKDIAILVNWNIEGSEVIDELLRYNLEEEDESKRIEVVSGESMLLRKSPSVRLIISNLRYFDMLNLTVSGNNTLGGMRIKEENMRRVLRQVDIDVSNAGILKAEGDQEEMAWKVGEMLKDNLRKKEDHINETLPVEDGKLQFNREYINIRKQMISDNADSFDLLSIVDNIVRKLVDSKIRESEKAFILAFMDCVIDYSSKYTATVHSFLKWWDENPRLSINSPEGRDAVNVLTIHKSKGLEFKCVIIPFANWKMLREDDAIWIDRDEMLLNKYFKDLQPDDVPPMMLVKTNKVKALAAFADDSKEMAFENALNARYEKMCQESYIDNLNKTYVAFTRAENEMHIFSIRKTDKNKKSNNDDAQDLSNLLWVSCESIDADYVDKLNREYSGMDAYGNVDVAVGIECEADGKAYSVGDAKQTYEHGTEDKLKAEKTDLANSTVEPGADDAAAENMIELPAELPQYHSNSRKVTVSLPDIYNSTQERGIKLHNLLSMLKRAKDRDRTLRIAERRGVTLRCEEDAKRLVDNVLADPVSKLWFADENVVINERTIFTTGEKNERPDRIIRTPDGRVVVIDYKFGTNHSRDSKYLKQVSEYMEKLKEAGMNVTEGYVWYPEGNVVLPVK